MTTTKATAAYWQQPIAARLAQQQKAIVRRSGQRIVPTWRVVRP